MARFAELIGVVVLAYLFAAGLFYVFVSRPLRKAAHDAQKSNRRRGK